MVEQTDSILFSGVFDVTELNKDGKRFDRVDRIHGKRLNSDMTLIMDFNSELFPIAAGDRLTVDIASSILPKAKTTAAGAGASAAGGAAGKAGASVSAEAAMNQAAEWREIGKRPTLADHYDYVMFGKVYRFDEASDSQVSVYISYGGMLMNLTGEHTHLNQMSIGDNVYLLMRR
ncbi:RNA polymerase [Ramicandelaber brevisporus]|nr:RNA polymerase [Ramicandelaber brevisporus]